MPDKIEESKKGGVEHKEIKLKFPAHGLDIGKYYSQQDTRKRNTPSRPKNVPDEEAPEVKDDDVHPEYRRPSKLPSLRSCCFIFGIVMLCLAGRSFHPIFNDKSPKPQPNITNITAHVESPAASDSKLSPPNLEQLVKGKPVKDVAKNPPDESTTSLGGPGSGSTTSPGGQDLLGQQNTNEGGDEPARPSTQSTPKPPTPPSDALVLYRARYDPRGPATYDGSLIPTPAPTSVPTPCPTDQRPCEWDVIFIRKKDPECTVVTVADIKTVAVIAYEWRGDGQEAWPLSVVHEIGVGHYAPYINHEYIKMIAPPFGSKPGPDNIYEMHPEARSRYVFDYNPRTDYFEEDGCVKPHIATRIMDLSRQAHRDVMVGGDGIQYHRSRLFVVNSHIRGGNLKTNFWLPLQIMSRAPWEKIHQRTPILEKCAFDEAIRQTGNERSLLPPFQARPPVIAIESKSSACRNVPFIYPHIGEDPNLKFWRWDHTHKCLNRGFRFDVNYARQAVFVGVQFFRQKFTGPSGGLIVVFNSEVVLRRMDESDGSYYNNGHPVLPCEDVLDDLYGDYDEHANGQTGRVGLRRARDLFEAGRAACRDEEGVLWYLRKRQNVYRQEVAWTRAPTLDQLSVRRKDGRHAEHHSRHILYLAENEDVDGVELADMRDLGDLVDQIRKVTPVVYKGHKPAEGRPVYSMEELNSLTFDPSGSRQRHQQCAESIAGALGDALVPCNMLSEAKLHFCVQYQGMTRAVPITTARGSVQITARDSLICA